MESDVIRFKGNKCRQDYCPSCKKDKGLVRLSRLNKDCHSCNSKKMAIVGATHNGRQAEVRVNNRLIRAKQRILISEETKEKISISNKRSWREKHGLPIDEQHKLCRTAFSKLLSRYAKKRSLTPRSEQSKFDCLEFSPQELFSHLESQFEPGMSWDNYGSGWHIDHKVPDSWFTYSSFYDEGFKQSWSLSNLQPLWAIDNFRKGNLFSN